MEHIDVLSNIWHYVTFCMLRGTYDCIANYPNMGITLLQKSEQVEDGGVKWGYMQCSTISLTS